MLCKVTLGVLKGASKLNVLLLLLLLVVVTLAQKHTADIFLYSGWK